MSSPESVSSRIGEPRLEHEHLQNLVALLLAAGETFVHATGEEALVHVHDLHLLAHEREEFERIDFGQAAMLARGIQRGLQQVDVVHARNLDRVLEPEKHAFVGALFRRQRQQVAALESHFPARDLVARAARQRVGEGALAGAVRPHDRVHLAGFTSRSSPLRIFLPSTLTCRLSIFNMAIFNMISPPLLPGSPRAGPAPPRRTPSAAP